MRLFTSVLASVAMLFVASSAGAVSFVVLGSSNLLVNPGEEFTIDIRLANPTLQNVAGVGGAVQGYDTNVVQFVTGSIGETSSFFCTNTLATACSNGLGNAIDAFSPLTEATVAGVGAYVQIVNAVTVTPRNGAGTKDPGIDGVIGGGDAEFRVTFRALNVPGAQTTLNIGTTTNATLGNVIVLAGGVTEQATNAIVTVTVVPEPGTALLMGLGLAGLAAAGRRE